MQQNTGMSKNDEIKKFMRDTNGYYASSMPGSVLSAQNQREMVSQPPETASAPFLLF